MTSVTITGSEGFIGSHLQIPGVDRVDLKFGLDVCDLDTVEDIVIHLAAVSFIPDTFAKPEETMRVNMVGLAHIIRLCQEKGSKLIFASSSGVVDPQSPYSYTKLWGEQMIKDSGVDYVILRFGNVYGEGDDKSAIYHFLTKPEIVIHGDGQIIRNFVYVGDAAAALKAVMAPEYSRVTLNVGNENMTIQQVAELFGKPISYDEDRRGDAFSHAMRSDWQCEVNLKDWLRGNGPV